MALCAAGDNDATVLPAGDSDATVRPTGARDREIGQVLDLERELQSPPCRRDRRRLTELLAPDFAEIGASGRVWNRTQVIQSLLTEDPEPILLADLDGRRIAEDVVMVQWFSERTGGRALRTSIWRRSSDGWQLMHHQGTPLH